VNSASFICVAIALVAAVSPGAWGQGGPPFRTDDPGTPGNRHWEVNVGLAGERTQSAGSYSIPNIDVNYGLGDRIQLKYELPLAVAEHRDSGGSVTAGLGNSLIGMKYRFFEHRPRTSTANSEPTFSFSAYPQLILSNPTRSVGRGVIEPGPRFFLPMEASARIGPLRFVAETGYWFNRSDAANAWIRGLMLGHEFRKGPGLYLEFYDQADVKGTGGKPAAGESTVGAGGRWPIVRNRSVLLTGMAGRSVTNPTHTNSQPRWIAYVGMQFLFGPHVAAHE
jgi:hypothetical protein